jgi:CheY-like chemotaxis protein
MNEKNERKIKGRLLVVENYPEMKLALQEVLEDAGYQVEIAANGEEGLNLFITFRPDLIISDIRMPVMDGPQLLTAVRKRPEGKLIPFIFLSAYREKVVINGDNNPQFTDFLTKPVSQEDLLTIVYSRIERMNRQ